MAQELRTFSSSTGLTLGANVTTANVLIGNGLTSGNLQMGTGLIGGEVRIGSFSTGDVRIESAKLTLQNANTIDITAGNIAILEAVQQVQVTVTNAVNSIVIQSDGASNQVRLGRTGGVNSIDQTTDELTMNATTSAIVTSPLIDLKGDVLAETLSFGASAGNSELAWYESATSIVPVAADFTVDASSYIEFTRIGNLVHYDIKFQWTAHTGSAIVVISNLPHLPTKAGNARLDISEMTSGAIINVSGPLFVAVKPGGDTTFAVIGPSTGVTAEMTATDFGATGTVYFQGVLNIV